MGIQQVPMGRGPFPSGNGWPLAELYALPEELARRYGLSLEEGCDFDWFQAAAIQLPNGSNALLIRYRGEFGRGTTVQIDSRADFAASLAVLNQTLGLRDDDLAWVSPAVDDPQFFQRAQRV